MASVRLENIVKIYGNDVVAVKDFNLAIADKEFIVLVGPSGCGKSTALRMIAGLEEITAGSLYIKDCQVNDLPAKDRNIAMVFQNYALYPHMNVYQNMEFGLKMRKMDKKQRKEKILATAHQLQIEELLQRKPSELSGGQRQRVALGRAMVREPDLFLLDEPLSNLDAKLRTEMRVRISKLHKELEATFIYVTHDQTEAMTMADRIVVMKDGLIQQIGTPTDIYYSPENRFVAAFIGTPQMNFLPAEIVQRAGCFYVKLLEELFILSDAEEALFQFIGQPLEAGFRPEALKIGAAENSVQADVELVEALGAESYLYLNYKGNRITAKVTGKSEAGIGDRIPVSFSLEQMHLFHSDSGMNLSIR